MESAGLSEDKPGSIHTVTPTDSNKVLFASFEEARVEIELNIEKTQSPTVGEIKSWRQRLKSTYSLVRNLSSVEIPIKIRQQCDALTQKLTEQHTMATEKEDLRSVSSRSSHQSNRSSHQSSRSSQASSKSHHSKKEDARSRSSRSSKRSSNSHKIDQLQDIRERLKNLALDIQCDQEETQSYRRGDCSPDNRSFRSQRSDMRSQRSDLVEKTDLTKILSEALNYTRLPIPEPSIFSGNPLDFVAWRSEFNTLLSGKCIKDSERIYYLRRYLSGTAKAAVDATMYLPEYEGYDTAMSILEERYGNSYIVAEAFRDKIETWKKIGPKDYKGLQMYVDFLQQCEIASKGITSLSVLNDVRENRKMCSKLPEWMVRSWNRKVGEGRGTYLSFKEFVKFLRNESRVLNNPLTCFNDYSSKEITHRTFQVETDNNDYSSKETTHRTFQVETESTDCLLCENNNHTLDNCSFFKKKSYEERIECIMKHGLCFKCLAKGHLSRECENRPKCKLCRGSHLTCLHRDISKKEVKETVENKRTFRTLNSNDLQGSLTTSILPVFVSGKNSDQEPILTYALLDSQSDSTFISSELADQLDTNSTEVKVRITTLNSTKLCSCQLLQNLKVTNFERTKTIDLPNVYSRETIPVHRDHIPSPETAKAWSHLEKLASVIPDKLNIDVGLLIGYNVPQALVPREVISGKRNEPYGQKTDLGWSIVGNTSTHGDRSLETNEQLSHTIITKTDHDINLDQDVIVQHFVLRTSCREIVQVLERDFAMDSCLDKTSSQDDLKFLDILNKEISRNDKGNYVLPLPFRDSHPVMPNNIEIAKRRLMSLKRKLDKDEKLYKDYNETMTMLLDKGYAEEVKDDPKGKSVWYIPHFAVYHKVKINQPRVVFDCSSNFRNECLNNYLLQGPDLLNSLFGVLCKFREEKIALTSDIEKMFYQFEVKTEDRDYIRFLYWKDGDTNQSPTRYRMTVHLFGAVSSPGCANFALKKLAADYGNDYHKQTVDFIKDSFYVDDGLTSCKTLDEAKRLVTESTDLCKQANIHLHKFSTNNRELLEFIPEDERGSKVKGINVFTDQLPEERTLGLRWKTDNDAFFFKVNIPTIAKTRRQILSLIASVYDPLGLIAPFILVGKHIMQELCREGVKWDDVIPVQLEDRWKTWIADLSRVDQISLPRCLKPYYFDKVKQCEIHHFSDGSTKGFGQCSYIRLIDINNQVNVSLLSAKARVTPMKLCTIPRIELSAALLSVKMNLLLQRSLRYNIDETYYWTDSKIVLSYLKNDVKRFHLFVANRLQQIKSNSDIAQWRYVPSSENPADHASRGRSVNNLLKSNWFTGPDFLRELHIPQAEKFNETIDHNDIEVKAIVNDIKMENPITEMFQRFSSWDRLKEVISVCQRYMSILLKRSKLKTRSKERIETSPYRLSTIEELKQAEITILKLTQREHYSEEISLLERGKATKSSSLSNLDPYLDKMGVLRVGGRLKKSQLNRLVTHPVIVPYKTHITTIIIAHFHNKIHHQGRGMTTNTIRMSGYWITSCSRAVSSYIYHCVTCKRLRSNPQTQKMADLPTDRTKQSPPFTYCGIDCFGPYIIKERRSEIKRYGLLITCMYTRAIHIEILDDLTTDSIINALRRLIALRGYIRTIRCDRGTNFIGASNELRRSAEEILDLPKLSLFLREQNCDFIFNPPSASHMGGIWERQIKTVKNVLNAVLLQKSAIINHTGLQTVFHEIASIVNSRPLTVQDLNDPTGPIPLSPNLLLTQKSNVILPPPGNFTENDLYLRNHWRKVQHLANEFWRRWRVEYLSQLQSRSKWRKTEINLKINDIVILKDDNLPRTLWKLGKVIETFQSEDKLVRRIKLQMGCDNLTREGKRTRVATILERPIHKVVYLLSPKI